MYGSLLLKSRGVARCETDNWRARYIAYPGQHCLVSATFGDSTPLIRVQLRVWGASLAGMGSLAGWGTCFCWTLRANSSLVESRQPAARFHQCTCPRVRSLNMGVQNALPPALAIMHLITITSFQTSESFQSDRIPFICNCTTPHACPICIFSSSYSQVAR